MPETAPPPYQRRTLWDRYARRMGGWAKPAFAAFLGAAGTGAFAVVGAVLASPGKIEALKVRVDSLAKAQERQGVDLRDVSEATWTFVALQCLTLNDSAFVSSRLPCGKAFVISGVVRRLSR